MNEKYAKSHDMTLLIFAVIERKHFGQNDSTSRNRPSLTIFVLSLKIIFIQNTAPLTCFMYIMLIFLIYLLFSMTLNSCSI